jgi:hypothetical protein
MVKVFEPGMLEAGRVARPDMLTPDASTLSIVSVTRPADASLASKLPTNGNGGSNGNGSNGGSNGSSNGSSNGKSGGNGSRNPEQE